jgi:hypothetical protein
MISVHLTTEELCDAGHACRVAAARAQRAADSRANPRLRAAYAIDAARFHRLAEKLIEALDDPRS